MLNKIRIVVFRGLKLRPKRIFRCFSVKSPHQDVSLGVEGHQSLARASTRFPDRTAKTAAPPGRDPGSASCGALKRFFEHETVLDLRTDAGLELRIAP